MERNIQVSNLPDVDEIDKAKIDLALSSSYDKLAKVVNNRVLLRAHFKAYKKQGSRKKHSVQLHLSVPGVELVASESDWNLITALQKALSNLEREAIEKVKK